MASEVTGEPEANRTMKAAVDDALAACNGDPRAVIRALLIALDATEREMAGLKAEVARIEAAVSGGYAVAVDKSKGFRVHRMIRDGSFIA